MQQAEGGRRQQVLLLARLGRGLDQRRGVPLREEDQIALRAQPLIEQHDLRALARSVRAFDGEELAGEMVLTVEMHNEMVLMAPPPEKPKKYVTRDRGD